MTDLLNHPAFPQSTKTIHARDEHYVAEAWESLNRGLCPCGEVVTWDPAGEQWEVDRTMVVLIVSPRELEKLREGLYIGEEVEWILDSQAGVQRELG